jgi:hypothetical protein
MILRYSSGEVVNDCGRLSKFHVSREYRNFYPPFRDEPRNGAGRLPFEPRLRRRKWDEIA